MSKSKMTFVENGKEVGANQEPTSGVPEVVAAVVVDAPPKLALAVPVDPSLSTKILTKEELPQGARKASLDGPISPQDLYRHVRCLYCNHPMWQRVPREDTCEACLYNQINDYYEHAAQMANQHRGQIMNPLVVRDPWQMPEIVATEIVQDSTKR